MTAAAIFSTNRRKTSYYVMCVKHQIRVLLHSSFYLYRPQANVVIMMITIQIPWYENLQQHHLPISHPRFGRNSRLICRRSSPLTWRIHGVFSVLVRTVIVGIWLGRRHSLGALMRELLSSIAVQVVVIGKKLELYWYCTVPRNTLWLTWLHG